MQAMLFLMLIIAGIALRSTTWLSEQRHEQSQASAVSWAMQYYNNAAMLKCMSNGVITCPSGKIALDTIPGAQVPYGVQIQTATDGSHYLVTTYRPSAALLSKDPAHLFGPVLTALYLMPYSGMSAGPWNASTATVHLHAGAAYSASQDISMPQGYGGLTFSNQQPVMVTFGH